MANVKPDRETKLLEQLITTKITNPLLGLDWLKQLRIKLETETINLKIQNIQEDRDFPELKSLPDNIDS